MTPEVEVWWHKYRYEKLLPQAIEEQKQHDKIRRVCWWMLAVCGVYLIFTAIASSYIESKLGVRIEDPGWEIVMILPAAIVGALGFIGVIMYKGNSVMELSKIGDTYIPKNP